MELRQVLECICYYCGKVKVDESNEKFKRAIKLLDPHRRFKAVWELCKGKSVCEGGQELDGEGPGSTHGGCGQKQPKYKKGPLKIVLEKINPKDEVWNV